MSTRATYKIDFTTFYIHHDGYPEGAAEYFAAALDPSNRVEDRAPNASLADDFIRANSRAELTESHQTHGDTEYRYTVRTTQPNGDRLDNPTIVAQKRVGWGDDTDWKTFFNATLDEFVTKYNQPTNGLA